MVKTEGRMNADRGKSMGSGEVHTTPHQPRSRQE